MQTKTNSSGDAATKDVVITRLFNAPRPMVWRAWTDPEHVVKWWGPKTYTAPSAKIDFRVGGKFLFCMRSPKGQNIWTLGVYREIVPQERIVYAEHAANEKGEIVPPSAVQGAPDDWPEETIVTVIFEDHAGKTRVVLRHSGLPTGKPSEMAGGAWSSALEKLAESLQ